MKKALFAVSFACAATFAAEYKIDATHSNVIFKVKHLAISTVTGNFGKFEGTLDFDPAKPSSLKTEAIIEANSINTNEANRDKHLKSDDFFAAEKHPKITFKSKKVEIGKDGKGTMTGDLTIRGITKPATLNVEFAGSAKDPWGNNKVAFNAAGKINRKDFDIKWSEKLDNGGLVVSEEVDVMLEIEANLVDKTKKKA